MENLHSKLEALLKKTPWNFKNEIWNIFEKPGPSDENITSIATLYSSNSSDYATRSAESKKFINALASALIFEINQKSRDRENTKKITLNILLLIVPTITPLIEELTNALPELKTSFTELYPILQKCADKRTCHKTFTLVAKCALACNPTPRELGLIYDMLPHTNDVRNEIVKKLIEMATSPIKS